MDTLSRLIVFAFLLVAGSARAIDSVPVQVVPMYTCTYTNNSATKATASTAEAACAAVLPAGVQNIDRGWYWERLVYAPGGGCTYTGTGGNCPFTITSTGVNKTTGGAVGSTSTSNGLNPFSGPNNVEACEAGSTMKGTGASKVCACDSGWMVLNNKCKQYTCPPSGSYSAVTQPDQLVQNGGDTVCTGGCGYQPSSWKVGVDGKIWATWPFKSTGSFCSGDPKASNPVVDSGEKNSQNPAPIPCGQNQCPGTVNGTAVCVPCQKSVENGPSSASSAASGASSGSSSTSTECNGVTCTTTTTTRDGSGAVTGTAQKTEKQESFCTENPQSSLCKQSRFGGSCAATTCDGDAVMCAMAAEQYKRNCELFDSNPLSQAGEGAMTGQAVPAGHPGAAPTTVNMTSSFQPGEVAAACLVDKSVTVLGKTVAVPFSKMCDPLRWMGHIAYAFALISAGFFLFRKVG